MSSDEDEFAAGCLRSEYLRFAKVCVDGFDKSKIWLLGMTLKRYLRAEFNEVVSNAENLPLLYSYMSDCTAHKVQKAVNSSSSEGFKIRRCGKELDEFLMERGYVKAMKPSGEQTHALLLLPPRPLEHGKNAWCSFTAYCEFFPCLKQLGHRGPSLSHFAADRAAFAATLRKVRQLHKAFEESKDDPEHKFLCLLNMVLGTGCPLHDAQGGFKWSMKRFVVGDVLHKLHITLESLRNSFSLIAGHVFQFIMVVIEFDAAEYDKHDVYAFWAALGVKVDLLDLLVEANPVWRNGRLFVSKAWADACEDWFQEVAFLISAVCNWRKFTESRWLGAGASSRSLIGSCACGLERLVQITRQDKSCTDFLLAWIQQL